MLNLNNVTKIYKNKRNSILALNSISFNMKDNDILFYLGPNGAGKTTTIKSILGILAIDSGDINVFGMDINNKKNRKIILKNIGIVIGNKSQLIWDLPILDSFKLLGNYYGLSNKEIKNNIEKYSFEMNIEKFLFHSPKTLSLGQRMRCEIVAAILHDPDLIIMDEPTIGLDIESKNIFKDYIKKMNTDFNKSYFITTHDLYWVEKINTRILVIDKGKIIYDGSTDKIAEKLFKKYNYTFKINGSINNNLQDLLKIFIDFIEKKELIIDDKNISINTNSFEGYDIMLKYITTNFKIDEIVNNNNINLEDIFVSILKGYADEKNY